MPGARPAKDLQSKSRKGGEEAEPPPSPFRGIRPRHQRGNELSPARWAPEERSSPAGHNFFEGSRKVVPEDRGRTRSRREESNLPAPSSNGAAWESKEEASPMNSRSGPGHERERESRSGGLTPPPPRKKAGACDGTSASSKAWPHPHAQKLSRFRPLWEARLAGRLARVFAEAGSCSLFRWVQRRACAGCLFGYCEVVIKSVFRRIKTSVISFLGQRGLCVLPPRVFIRKHIPGQYLLPSKYFQFAALAIKLNSDVNLWVKSANPNST